MPGNGRVFISHAPEDTARCALLVAALDAWGVDFWFDTRPAEEGQQLNERIQKAIGERSIFLRVCTGAIHHSFAMGLQTNAFRGLQAEDRKHRRGGNRLLINLILASDYVREPFDNATLFIDGVNRPRPVWMAELGRSLGVAAPVGNRLSRRALLGYSAAAAVTIGSTAAAGALVVENQNTAQKLRYAPGRIAWQMNGLGLKKDVPPVPVVAGDTLYVATGAALTAYDFTTRHQLWRREYAVRNAFVAPDVDNGVVYTAVDNGLYALNAGDGSQRWTAYLPSSGNIFTTPVVADGFVYVLSDTGNLYGFQARDGSNRWSDPIDLTYGGLNDVGSAPAVAGGLIVIGSVDHSVYAFNAHDGSPRWKLLTRGKIVSTPVVVNGVVYVGSTDSYVYALRASDGTLKWKYRTQGDVESMPNIVDGVVYIGSNDHYVYTLDADSGEPYWRAPMGDVDSQTGIITNSGNITCQPAVTGDAVVAIERENYSVRSFDRSDGTQRWTYVSASSVQNADPIAANGVILFGSGDRNLYAFGA